MENDPRNHSQFPEDNIEGPVDLSTLSRKYAKKRNVRKTEFDDSFHDPSRNEESSNFFFTQRRGTLKWRILTQIDPYQVMEDVICLFFFHLLQNKVDIETLEGITKNLTFSKIEKKDLRFFSEDNFVRLFKLSQLVIEYLLFIQNFLNNKTTRMEEDIIKILDRHRRLKTAYERKREQTNRLKKEIRKCKKTLYTYNLLYGADPEKTRLKLQERTISGGRRENDSTLAMGSFRSDEMKTLREQIENLQKKVDDQKVEHEMSKITNEKEIKINEENSRFKEYEKKQRQLIEQNEMLHKTIVDLQNSSMNITQNRNPGKNVRSSAEINRKVDLRVEETIEEMVGDSQLVDLVARKIMDRIPVQLPPSPKKKVKKEEVLEVVPKRKEFFSGEDEDVDVLTNLKIDRNIANAQAMPMPIEVARVDSQSVPNSPMRKKRRKSRTLRSPSNADKKKAKQEWNDLKRKTLDKFSVRIRRSSSGKIPLSQMRQDERAKARLENKLDRLVNNSDGMRKLMERSENIGYTEKCFSEAPYLTSLFNHGEMSQRLQLEVLKCDVESELLRSGVERKEMKDGKLANGRFSTLMNAMKRKQLQDDAYFDMYEHIQGFVNRVAKKRGPVMSGTKRRTMRKRPKLRKTASATSGGFHRMGKMKAGSVNKNLGHTTRPGMMKVQKKKASRGRSRSPDDMGRPPIGRSLSDLPKESASLLEEKLVIPGKKNPKESFSIESPVDDDIESTITNPVESSGMQESIKTLGFQDEALESEELSVSEEKGDYTLKGETIFHEDDYGEDVENEEKIVEIIEEKEMPVSPVPTSSSVEKKREEVFLPDEEVNISLGEKVAEENEKDDSHFIEIDENQFDEPTPTPEIVPPKKKLKKKKKKKKRKKKKRVTFKKVEEDLGPEKSPEVYFEPEREEIDSEPEHIEPEPEHEPETEHEFEPKEKEKLEKMKAAMMNMNFNSGVISPKNEKKKSIEEDDLGFIDQSRNFSPKGNLPKKPSIDERGLMDMIDHVMGDDDDEQIDGDISEDDGINSFNFNDSPKDGEFDGDIGEDGNNDLDELLDFTDALSGLDPDDEDNSNEKSKKSLNIQDFNDDGDDDFKSLEKDIFKTLTTNFD